MNAHLLFEKGKYLLSKSLSPSQKSIARFLAGCILRPLRLKQHLNTYQYEKALFSGPILSYTPPVFSVAITEQCNLRCPTCLFLLENKNLFHNAFVTPEKFRELLARTNPDKVAEVIFLGGGEPLLHPHIREIIAISREYGFIPKLSTNGILLAKKLDELEDIDYINVSLDSFDYDSFSKYRGGTPRQFDLIKQGIAELRNRRIHFSISFLLSSENIGDVDKMIALAIELQPPFVYFHNINPHGCSDYAPLTLQDPVTREFLEKMIRRTDYPFDIYISTIFDSASPKFKKTRCIQPWYYFCFNTQGDIAYCCHLPHNPQNGNAFLENSVNSPALQEFRQSILDGKIPVSCLYCQRRFMDSEFGKFDASLGKWFINRAYPDYVDA